MHNEPLTATEPPRTDGPDRFEPVVTRPALNSVPLLGVPPETEPNEDEDWK
jgi:hypothetical protein